MTFAIRQTFAMRTVALAALVASGSINKNVTFTQTDASLRFSAAQIIRAHWRVGLKEWHIASFCNVEKNGPRNYSVARNINIKDSGPR